MYTEICNRDMEGIVCKPLISPYHNVGGRTTWIKVKNPNYSQAEGRRELFNKRRGGMDA
jgi:ATP-dependent DNA ligase